MFQKLGVTWKVQHASENLIFQNLITLPILVQKISNFNCTFRNSKKLYNCGVLSDEIIFFFVSRDIIFIDEMKNNKHEP